MRMVADAFRGTVTTYNVLAESSDGATDNVVMAGGHLDSVNEGPGINDNGSGVAALLETAVQMQRVKPRNQVRFAFWGGTEDGNRGSVHYAQDAGAALGDIALYLSFAVIGSPNYALFVYDGDGSDTGFPQAPGSEAIEVFFQDFYAERGLPSEPVDLVKDAFNFEAAGIPLGGIFTGTFVLKTEEQAALYGGIAGEQFDPCYHLACDTFDNVSLQALDVNSDAVAAAVLQFAMSTEAVNGRSGKGNFGPKAGGPPADVGPTRTGQIVR
jgi:Zn-dependent M28 family amino/carboxypeptidase